MTHGVHDVVNSQSNGLPAFLERFVPVIEILPEIANVVVIVRNHTDNIVIVDETPEGRYEIRSVLAIRRIHLQSWNVIEGMENRMTQVQALEMVLGNRKFQIVPQHFEFIRSMQIVRCSKIVGHDESAAP